MLPRGDDRRVQFTVKMTLPFMKTHANADGLSVSVTVDTTIMRPYFSADVADSNLLSVFQNQVMLVPIPFQ